MMADKLFIVIPAYNEQDNIKQLVDDWYPIADKIPDACIVIINDGSTDRTYQILKMLQTDRPKLEVLTKENGGHGDTLLYGYHYAIEHGADWIFQTDSDGQTKAAEFWDFWKQKDKYDAIFGFRKKRGDGAGRKLVEKFLCLLLRLIFGVKVPDSNCPFRLMKADKVSTYIARMPEHYSLPNVMLTVFFAYNKDRIAFKEISFENRKGGTGSINIRKIVNIGIQSIKDFSKFRKQLKEDTRPVSLSPDNNKREGLK